MPNWCNNNITITGPNSVIDKIEKIVAEEDGLLQYFHPMPKELNDTTAPLQTDAGVEEKHRAEQNKKLHGHDNWYDWCVDNWSTKWDVNEFHGVERQHLNDSLDESTIKFGFDSAWAPPTGAYEHFIDKNSNVTIYATYFESGCDFMGIWDNGGDECYTISEIAPDGSKDNFWTSRDGKELDDLYGITENMAQYEADQEEERIGDNKKIIKYSKGEKVNV